MFRELVGDTAVLQKSGVYFTAQLYEYQGGLFAGMGAKYVRVNANGTTSVDKMFLVSLSVDVPMYVDRLGRVKLTDSNGAKLMEPTVVAKLENANPD